MALPYVPLDTTAPWPFSDDLLPRSAPLGKSKNPRPKNETAEQAEKQEREKLGKKRDRRKFAHRTRARLTRVDHQNGLHRHGMHTCCQFTGYTGARDPETGKRERYPSMSLAARYDPENDRAEVHQEHLAHCGSSMVCPVCGPIIMARRQKEIEQILVAMTLAGYKWLMLTLTARHDFSTLIGDFIPAFTAAKDRMFEHSRFKQLARLIGKVHHIVATEITLDNLESPEIVCGEKSPSGWHYHLHFIIFYDSSDDAALDEFEHGADVKLKSGRIKHKKGIKDLWLYCLEKHGLSGMYDVAADVTKMDVNKTDVENIDAATRYMCKDMAFEASGSANKQGRKASRMGIRDLQILVAYGQDRLSPERYAHYCKMWVDYVRAIKGKSPVYCTPGLKAFCGLTDLTDDEIVNQGEPGDVQLHEWCAYQGESDYYYIGRQGGQGYMMDVIERQINDDQEAKAFVKLCHENKGNPQFAAQAPRKFAEIVEFCKICAKLAIGGYDVEPYALDFDGNTLHMMLDQDLRMITCETLYDDRLPRICAGDMQRDPAFFARVTSADEARILRRLSAEGDPECFPVSAA